VIGKVDMLQFLWVTILASDLDFENELIEGEDELFDLWELNTTDFCELKIEIASFFGIGCILLVRVFAICQSHDFHFRCKIFYFF
jgi:hypothetical protein